MTVLRSSLEREYYCDLLLFITEQRNLRKQYAHVLQLLKMGLCVLGTAEQLMLKKITVCISLVL